VSGKAINQEILFPKSLKSEFKSVKSSGDTLAGPLECHFQYEWKLCVHQIYGNKASGIF